MAAVSEITGLARWALCFEASQLTLSGTCSLPSHVLVPVLNLPGSTPDIKPAGDGESPLGSNSVEELREADLDNIPIDELQARILRHRWRSVVEFSTGPAPTKSTAFAKSIERITQQSLCGFSTYDDVIGGPYAAQAASSTAEVARECLRPPIREYKRKRTISTIELSTMLVPRPQDMPQRVLMSTLYKVRLHDGATITQLSLFPSAGEA